MLRWLSLGLAAVCCLVLFRLGVTAPRHITLNANEGWNAYHAAGVIAGRPLYPSPPGLFRNNYPPLSFYMTAALGRVVGDVLLAGRILSLLSFVVWAIALGLTARRLGCAWDEAAFAAALCAVHILVFADYYVGVDDPQLLAHGLAAFAPFVLLREPRTTGSLLLCALLCTAGIFVKHNLIAVPLACVLWLLWFDRRAGWRLIAFGALIGVAAFGASVLVFGPGFVEGLMTPRASLPGKWLTMTRQWWPLIVAPLAALAVLMRQAARDRQVAFGVVLAVIAVAVAELSFSQSGVYWNTAFDAAWALSLTAALAINRLPRVTAAHAARLRAALVAGSLAAAVVVVAGRATYYWGSPRFWLDPRWAEVESTAREVEFIAAHPGPVLCENLALCYWAGKPAEVDFFNLSERILREPGAGDELLRRLDSGGFALAQIDDPTHDLGARFDAAIARTFVLDHKGRWGSLLVPRAAP